MLHFWHWVSFNGLNLRGEWLNNGFFRQFSRCTSDGNALHLPVVHSHTSKWCQSLSDPKEPAPALVLPGFQIVFQFNFCAHIEINLPLLGRIAYITRCLWPQQFNLFLCKGRLQYHRSLDSTDSFHWTFDYVVLLLQCSCIGSKTAQKRGLNRPSPLGESSPKCVF